MSVGALLVGLAAAVVLAAYVALPFRKTKDPDQQIEAWLAALRAAQWDAGAQEKDAELWKREVPSPKAAGDALTREGEPVSPVVDSDVAFCHQCGRPVRSHHRFCPRCGAHLDEDGR